MRRMHYMVATGLAVATLQCAPTLSAQTNFEGVLTLTMHNSSSSGKPTTMIQTTKGHKMKIEGWNQGKVGGGTMILDGDTKTMMIVIPEKRQYMLWTQDMAAAINPMASKMRQQHQRQPAGGESKLKINYSNTGRTETIAGVKCQVWHGTAEHDGKHEEGEVCLAKGVGFDLFGMMDTPASAQAKELVGYRKIVGPGKGIMKMVKIENGKRTTEMEVTKVDRKSINDATFKPPAGYTEFNPMKMMQQMQQQKHGALSK